MKGVYECYIASVNSTSLLLLFVENLCKNLSDKCCCNENHQGWFLNVQYHKVIQNAKSSSHKLQNVPAITMTINGSDTANGFENQSNEFAFDNLI